MIRPFTIVCMLMAVGSGLYLYQCKHQAQVLDREIARTIKQTDAARERIGMLRAEWAQLNEPERIAELARAHSLLQTARPTQFIAANELVSKLPPPVVPAHQLQPTDGPEDTEAATPTAEAEPPVPHVAAATSEPKPIVHAPVATDPKPVQLAVPTPVADPKPTHHVATASPPAQAQAQAPALAPATPQVASVHPVSRPIASPRAVAPASMGGDAVAPGTVGAAVLRSMRSREAAPAREQATYVQPIAAPVPSYSPPRSTPLAYAPQPVAPSYPPQAYAAPIGGSVLGGRSSALPPPVPFAAR